jgi:hypothetical protein
MHSIWINLKEPFFLLSVLGDVDDLRLVRETEFFKHSARLPTIRSACTYICQCDEYERLYGRLSALPKVYRVISDVEAAILLASAEITEI